MRLIVAILIFLSALAGSVARAAHTQVQFILPSTAKAGDTVLVGVQLKMESDWHTYWKNPGESGQATEIKWTLPAGVTAGEIEWPLPHKIPPADVVTYGYEHEVVLLVPLKLDASLPAGPLELKAKVAWLECKESCIPADAEITGTINVGGEAMGATGDANSKTIADWQSKVPVAPKDFSVQAYWDGAATDDTRSLILQWPGQTNGANFFPYANDDYEIQGATEMVSAPAGEIHLRKQVKKFSGDWPKEISGVIITGTGDAPRGFEVKLAVAEKVAAATAVAPAGGAAKSAATGSATPVPLLPPIGTLLVQLLAALAGGIILNLMPCVLPILSLKILSLVQLHGKEAAEGRRHSLIYLLGVLVSFWVIAGLVIAGRLASWGEQFQDSRFIIIITVLMTVIALNLFGVFEFVLPSKTVSSAAELASRGGNSGAFFNGVVAVVLGASCVAPLMAPAIGWAITQSPLVIALVFTAIGTGLALPYVLLTYFPPLQKLLPRPGAWMEKFKIALGFPMLGMAAWSLSLLVGHHGQQGVLWIGVFLVMLGFAAWVYGEFIQRGSRRKGLAWLIVLASVGGGYAYTLENRVDWRHPVVATESPGAVQNVPGGIEWQPWSAAAIAQAQAASRPVLVDFTADWCLTCLLNKKSSIEIDSVRKKLKELNFVTLIGDYTRKNPDITAELKRFERAGVPLVLVYSKDASKSPQLLPAVLTPGIVLDALDQAAK
jgi:thiol:disulfide interchange protein DsbD